MLKIQNSPHVLLTRLNRWKLIVFLLSVSLIVIVLVTVTIGSMDISLPDVYTVLIKNLPFIGDFVQSDVSAIQTEVVLKIRLPRVLVAAVVGVALAAAGTVLQGLLRNPMADPYVLGISAGASVGASLAIGFGFGSTFLGFLYAVPLLAFIGALTTIFVVYNIAKRSGGNSMLTLLLIGIAISSFLSAIVSLIKIISSDALQGIVYWIMGSLQLAGWNHLYIASPFIFGGIIIIFFYAKDLNIISLGENQAQHLGVDVDSLKTRLLICVSLITAAAVSVSGIIGFIGLIIPHMTRLLVGPDHRILIPTSALLGAIVLIICDTLARTLMSPAEIPVGIITSVLGSPFFVYLLIKRKKTVGSWH
ncbi:MAG: iron chelate uptake ABC transporter family permease subunit [Candidatus Bathyarchaeota archaeon]|nr:iron chelate uptake ABC transporter family permease subunit [Candidatus Bathyarchaeum tardum]WGM90686.1 MAG: iron chelate uptake ABC transporter family permease subunit [Candidatus Bathyarchaeum tardum]